MNRFTASLFSFAAIALSAATSNAAVIISEVHPSGSGNGTYAADWFEITNTGPASVDLTGWSMDDNSNTLGVAPLRGVAAIASGQSVVFIESPGAASDSALFTAFKNAWFGASVPAGFTMGAYTGSGVGLGAGVGGDAVNIFDSSSLVARVSFDVSTVGKTFDNAIGLNNSVISQISAVGVNNAFLSFNGGETGSPGVVPEPASIALLGVAGMSLIVRRRRAITSR